MGIGPATVTTVDRKVFHMHDNRSPAIRIGHKFVLALVVAAGIFAMYAVCRLPAANAEPVNAPDPSVVPSVASAFQDKSFFCTGDIRSSDGVRFIETGGVSIAERDMTLQLLEIKDGIHYPISDTNLVSGFGSEPQSNNSVIHVKAGVVASFDITLVNVAPDREFGLRAMYDDNGTWTWLSSWKATQKDRCGVPAYLSNPQHSVVLR